DLTPWLTVLLEKVGATALPAADPSDRSGQPEIRPAMLKDGQDLAMLSEEAERVMPKGRNFQ
ncbi:hypothetical protein, partial [Mesorhizobium sp. LNHC229A00]